MSGEKKQLNPIWAACKPFVNGGGSGMLSTIVMQPVDMVKVRIQLGDTGSPVSHAAAAAAAAASSCHAHSVAFDVAGWVAPAASCGLDPTAPSNLLPTLPLDSYAHRPPAHHYSPHTSCSAPAPPPALPPCCSALPCSLRLRVT